MTSVVVVGASIAGLLSARALADVVDDVLVLERERLPADIVPRGRVPQGRHIHILLGAGQDRLQEWFPGIDAELQGLGVPNVDGTRGWFYQWGGYRAQGDWGPPNRSMTRPLLEHVIRRRIAELPNVRVEDGVRVGRLDVRDGRATGVEVDGELRPADLVADCSGRSSRLAHQLEVSGLLVPPVSRVTIDCAYTSGVLPRRPDDLDGSFVVCGSSPPARVHGGAVMPVEGDRWMVTLSGVHGDVPGTSPEQVLDFARTLPIPTVAELIELVGPLTSVATYRFPSSQRRHYEKLDRLLPGYVAVGDAACSFNPVYGQGMACAALQAAALGETVRALGPGAEELPRRFHRTSAAIIDVPWAIAVGADFQLPETVGTRPRGAALTNRYVAGLVRASHTSVPVAKAFNLALHLSRPLTSLGRPSVVARVAAASLPGRRAAAPTVHPRVGPRS